MFLLTRSVSQGNRNKNKNKQMGPNQSYKLLYSKGNHKKNKTKKDNEWNRRKYLQIIQQTKA